MPDKNFLFDLLNTPSPTGFESAGQQKWKSYVSQFAPKVQHDAYGNAWATHPGNGSARVMFEAHADEIGFMVSYVAKEGFIYITRIGGSDRAIARGKRVHILSDKGTVLGVIGNKAIHMRKASEAKAPEWHELYIDIGASSDEEVAERGIRVGHPIVYADKAEKLSENTVISRALDNRIGGYIIAEVMARLAGGTAATKSEATIIALNAVQEEIGGHGAKMATHRLQPTVAVVIDVTHSTDSPGVDQKKYGDVKLGAGPSVTHGSANHPAVVKRLMKVAKEEKITVQHEATSMYTGTDTDQIFKSRSGVPAALVSIPMRYMHSTIEMVDMRDVEDCIKLLTAFARSIKADETFDVLL